MKKLIVLILLVIYASTTIGATIQLHYCMNQFSNLSLTYQGEDEKCRRCGMTENKNGCCHDKKIQFKIKLDQQKTGVIQFKNIQFGPIKIYPDTKYLLNKIYTLTKTYPVSHAPPFSFQERFYVLHCTYLI